VQRPEIQAAFEVAGAFDLTLVVVADDMEAFNAFADSALASDPGVRRFETRFVRRRRKFTTARPLPRD
jgi:Lrp/AsnC family leucine-responsive transcriptional regulator